LQVQSGRSTAWVTPPVWKQVHLIGTMNIWVFWKVGS
jgi:hypothetical protein